MDVLIADDHPLVREGCKMLVEQLDPKARVCEANDFDQVLSIVGEQPDLDLVLLDLVMPGMHDAESIKTLLERLPDAVVVVVSAHADAAAARRALRAGAAGYIPKSASRDVTINALRLILTGGRYFPPELLENGPRPTRAGLAEGLRPYEATPLTRRQLEVLKLMASGYKNSHIAEQLGLAVGTVKVHIAAIYKVLNVANRTQAVTKASRLGLISLTDA